MDDTLYDQVGGDAFFYTLIDDFYDVVEGDESLRPMYPEDLTESKRHLALFLIQYWGGPRTYQEERGHPRLRLRHAPFRVTKGARDAWLRAMSAAIEKAGERLTNDQRDELHAYFDMAAQQLRNV